MPPTNYPVGLNQFVQSPIPPTEYQEKSDAVFCSLYLLKLFASQRQLERVWPGTAVLVKIKHHSKAQTHKDEVTY